MDQKNRNAYRLELKKILCDAQNKREFGQTIDEEQKRYDNLVSKYVNELSIEQIHKIIKNKLN